MKKQNFFIASILLMIIGLNSLFAQQGKPQYNIRCERLGSFIGNIKIELFPLIAPLHVANFDSLVSIHFYDTTAFHRVVPNFVIQGGDPNSRHGDPSTWGFGDPTQTNVPAEFSNVDHARGILGAARDQNINSANSQFFINVVRNSGLNGNYTVYGRVYEGMDIVDTIVNSPTVPDTERPVQKIEMFVTESGLNNSVPTIPILTTPANNEFDVHLSPVFQWQNVDDAVLYRLQIAKDSLFQNLVYNNTVGTTSFSSGVNFEQGMIKYYWRVKANNGAFESDYSPAYNFTTGISLPQLLNPADSATQVSSSPILEWTSVTNAVSYKLLVATSSAFLASSIIVNQNGLTSHSFQLSNLLPNKTYYWKVAASTATYSTNFTTARRFTTGNTTDLSDENLHSKYFMHQNYPNPFNPSTVISYQLSASSNVVLKIYDVLGKEVATLIDNEWKEAGFHNYKLLIINYQLPSGIYFYKLQAGGFVQTKKMILLR